MPSDRPRSDPAQTRRLGDLVVLVLSASDVGKHLAPVDLETLVHRHLQVSDDGAALDLGPLWSALIADPGLSEFKLAPPFLQVKAWEARLAIQVTLPTPLASLDRAQWARHLTRLVVKGPALDALLDPPRGAPAGTPPAPAAASQAAARPVAPPAAPAPTPPPAAPVTGRRKLVVILAGTVFAASLAVLATMLFSGPGHAYRAARLDAVIRVTQARRVGHAVTAVLADPGWAARPEAERRRLLERAFGVIEAEGVRSLVLRDATGATRAVASSLGGERSFRVE